MTSDEELMAAYVGGEQAAFDEIFRRYAGPLSALMRRYSGDADQVQDLLQQTFLNLHRARRDFRSGARLRPWLYTIAHNVAREHGRRRARQREAPLEQEPVNGERKRADEKLVNGERAAAVRRALAALPESQRQVVELHWYDGLSFAEIAEVLGAGLSAVKVRAHRGYQTLRQRLGPRAL